MRGTRKQQPVSIAPRGRPLGSRGSAIATVTSKGQVTVPRDVRRALGLSSGSLLRFEWGEQEGHAAITAMGRSITDLFGLVTADRRRKRMSFAEMDAAIRRGATR